MTLRNLIIVIIALAFLAWYAVDWTYKTQFRAPRDRHATEINNLRQQIERDQANVAFMRQANAENQWLYHRSLPRVPNDAQRYSFWLMEALQVSGLDNNVVNNLSPAPVPPTGWNFGFQVRTNGTLTQFTDFLFHFYHAPFLHRITSLTLNPIEGDEERLDFIMTVNALALNTSVEPSFQPTNQLPMGLVNWVPRLPFNYQMTTLDQIRAVYDVIGERNLLRTARGGIDRADFTYLTALIGRGDQREVWFRVWTDPDGTPPTVARLRSTVQFGSFVGEIVEIHEQDIVLYRNGTRWLLELGESLNEAFALPPETGFPISIDR